MHVLTDVKLVIECKLVYRLQNITAPEITTGETGQEPTTELKPVTYALMQSFGYKRASEPITLFRLPLPLMCQARCAVDCDCLIKFLSSSPPLRLLLV